MVTKGRPSTIRLRSDVERRLEEEARRLRQSKTAMLETLADEVLGMRRFAGIGFAGPEHDRRACVQGTGLEVWEVVMLAQSYGDMACSTLVADHPLTDRKMDSVASIRKRSIGT